MVPPLERKNFDLNLIPDAEAEDEKEMNPVEPFSKAVSFRFQPTDQELILGYLQPFSQAKPLPKNQIHQENIYGFNPLILSVDFEKSNERDLFFFSSRSSAKRVSRTAQGGFWHSTTGRKDVFLGKLVIGTKQNFSFYNGKPVNGKPPKDGKTTWLMVEYLLLDAKKSSTEQLTLMDVDSSIDIINSSSSNTKEEEEQKRHCVLSRIYKSDPVENHTEDYALLIKHKQELAIKHEELWQDMRTKKKH